MGRSLRRRNERSGAGSPQPSLAAAPRDPEEESVETEWGLGRYDARTHSLSNCFGQHLNGDSCWRLLESAEKLVRRGEDWGVQVGAWAVGNEATQSALQPLIDVHRSLAQEAPRWSNRVASVGSGSPNSHHGVSTGSQPDC